MDYRDVVIHIFDEENRLFYDLERIWRDCSLIERESLNLKALFKQRRQLWKKLPYSVFYLTHETEYTDYFAQNLKCLIRFYNNRIHKIIFWLKTNMSLFFIECFYCCRIIYQRTIF